MGKRSRIRVTGVERAEIDVDLLVQALLGITERRLQIEHEEEARGEASA